MDRVDYVDTFIAVADDCAATAAIVPPSNAAKPSIAALIFEMVADHPYRFTAGDVIFTVFADRHGIPERDRPAARGEFYSRNQACLRSSELGKRYGWVSTLMSTPASPSSAWKPPSTPSSSPAGVTALREEPSS